MSRRRGDTRGRARDRPRNVQQSGKQAQQDAGRVSVIPLSPVWGTSRAQAEMCTSEVIYSAVSRIANALATMPIHLYRGHERLADDPRDVMLSLRPNPRQSAYSFKQAMEVCRNTEGCAYAVKLYDSMMQLRGLGVLDPTKVTPFEEEKTGEIYYRIVRNDGVEEWLHNYYVISLFHTSTNGLSGVRVVDVLRSSIEYDADIKRFSLENLQSINRGVVLTFPSTMSGPKRKNAVDEFLKIYRECGGQIIALESGMTASQLSMSPIDSKAVDVEQLTRSRVAMVYNLPPSLLGDTSSAGKSSTEEQVSEFLTLTMQPIVQMWEDELNWKLLLPEERKDGYEIRIDAEAYLRTSALARAEIAQSRVRCGLRTVNEIRAQEYRAPIPGGNVAMISKDLAPVHLVAQGATIDADAINGAQNS